MQSNTNDDSDAWEQAYLRFRTSAQEDKAFRTALRQAGADEWNRDAEVLELFCGRGGGVRTLCNMGFKHVKGIDISENLIAEYCGPGQLYRGDCRELPFADSSANIVVVRDGLHHLSVFPDDLEMTLSEIYRVLKSNGRVVIFEPWSTAHLRLLHGLIRIQPLRRLWNKLDAFAIMVEIEKEAYYQWLSHADDIIRILKTSFETERCVVRKGQLMYVGTARK